MNNDKMCSLGAFWRSLGLTEEAVGCLQTANGATLLVNIGHVQRSMGDPDAALATYKEARGLFKVSGSWETPAGAECRRLIGMLSAWLTRSWTKPALEAPCLQQIHRIAVGGTPALKVHVHNNLESSFCECLIEWFECSVFMCMRIGKAFVTGATRQHD